MTTIPVAMAVYNGEKYIKEQIDSILVQLGENDEMIISYLGGMKRFVLGGGYGQDDGIYQYKVCLAPKGIVDFYIGRRIFDQENYQMLVDLRIENGTTDLKQEYFPKYRS